MAYEPNVWKCGDTITADQLNRLEQAVAELSQGGGQSGALVVRKQEEQSITGVMLYDKTWQEAYDALNNGQLVMLLLKDFDGEGFEASYLMQLLPPGDEESYFAMFGRIEKNTSETATADDAYATILTSPTADDYLRIQITNPDVPSE